MPRQIAGPKPGTLLELVPQFGRNATAAPADRVRVFVRAPSEGEKREYLVAVLDRVTFEPGAEQPTVAVKMAEAFERQQRAIAKWVDHVDNYAAADGSLIVTAADLWEFGEAGLVGEVFVYIEGLLALSSVEAKNSAGSSASSPAATQALNGGATSAAHAIANAESLGSATSP